MAGKITIWAEKPDRQRPTANHPTQRLTLALASEGLTAKLNRRQIIPDENWIWSSSHGDSNIPKLVRKLAPRDS